MLTPYQISVLDAGIEVVLPNLDLSNLTGKRLFITGGTGFFGIWLLTALRVLRTRGVEVQVCVLSRDPNRFLDRYPQFREQEWLDFVSGNVRNFKISRRCYDLLIHGATETSMSAHDDQMGMFDDIILGTRRVLELAKNCGTQRVLLISSGAVYGVQPSYVTHQLDESPTACNPWHPRSAYGEGKRVMEMMGAMAQQETDIKCLAARCFAFCGPGLPLDGHFAIGNFIHDALNCDQITVQGDGSPKRSYLFGADLAVWLLYLLVEGKPGGSYNVGSDEPISILDLAYRVRDVLAPDTPVKVMQPSLPLKSTGSNNYVPDISRAREIGCRPWTSLNDSLLSTASFLKKIN